MGSRSQSGAETIWEHISSVYTLASVRWSLRDRQPWFDDFWSFPLPPGSFYAPMPLLSLSGLCAPFVLRAQMEATPRKREGPWEPGWSPTFVLYHFRWFIENVCVRDIRRQEKDEETDLWPGSNLLLSTHCPDRSEPMLYAEKVRSETAGFFVAHEHLLCYMASLTII